MVNAANQAIIYFDKPEDIELEDIQSYLNNLGCLQNTSAGCGDPL